jgi:hypothetical protein
MMHGPEKSDPAIVAGKDEACWRRRVWVGPPARCPPASSILAQGDLTAWLGMKDSNSEMSSQIIPLKGRTDSGKPAQFWPQRLFAVELRSWECAA